MPRGRLHFVSGIVWHITQRCHDRSFLLKFHRDKKRWLEWLFKARQAYGLQVLNYTVTSNHIHLLVLADQRRMVIPRSMQLVAGRTAWEYNHRKNRSGAYWEGAYSATAVQDDHHLFECMAYIDLNMVRAGVVSHPREWRFCGYHELWERKQRYCLIDLKALKKIMGFEDLDQMMRHHDALIDKTIEKRGLARDERWTEHIAVGDRSFMDAMKQKLGYEIDNTVVGNNTFDLMLRY